MVDKRGKRVYNNYMANVLSINDIQECVTKVAKMYGVEKVILFGSYASGKQKKNSDVDLLVEFSNDASLFTLAGFKIRVQDIIKKNVDVVPFPIPNDSFLEIDNEVLLYARA